MSLGVNSLDAYIFLNFLDFDVDNCKLMADRGNSFRVMDPGKCFAVQACLTTYVCMIVVIKCQFSGCGACFFLDSGVSSIAI